MSRIYHVLVVLVPLMLLLLLFYYGVNSNGITAVNIVAMVVYI